MLMQYCNSIIGEVKRKLSRIIKSTRSDILVSFSICKVYDINCELDIQNCKTAKVLPYWTLCDTLMLSYGQLLYWCIFCQRSNTIGVVTAPRDNLI